MPKLLRYLWTSPNTLLGLFFALLARLTGGHVTLVEGVTEACGGVLPRLLRNMPTSVGGDGFRGAVALTLGHVVLAADRAALDRTRFHERVHVRQYERWGPLFIPAYLLASLVAYCRGKDHYRDNRFEVEAFRLTDIHRHTL